MAGASKISIWRGRWRRDVCGEMEHTTLGIPSSEPLAGAERAIGVVELVFNVRFGSDQFGENEWKRH